MRVDVSSDFHNVEFFFAYEYSDNPNVDIVRSVFQDMPLQKVIDRNEPKVKRIDLSIASFNSDIDSFIEQAEHMLEAAHAAKSFQEVLNDI